MSNTVITNYTDLNGPSTKAESSVVVIVNKDGSLSVDQNLLGTLMGTDGTQGAISVVRIGHEGKPDDATDSENEDDKLQHVTLSVDSYYGEPNSIIKYDSGAEMLQSLRIETRENSLIGFHNDHCYTTLTLPNQDIGTVEKANKSDSLASYDDPIIEITQSSPVAPPKSVPSSKKITILEQQIIPKGKKILIKPTESPIILKGNDVLTKTLPVITKQKKPSEKVEGNPKQDESTETSSISSSGESVADRDSDSDYKDTKDKSALSFKVKRSKVKPRILKGPVSKVNKTDVKITTKLKFNKNVAKKDIKDKATSLKILRDSEQNNDELNFETLIPTSKIPTASEIVPVVKEISRVVVKQSPKPPKKEKKTPAHVTALLTDMSSLFSTPDVIRRVSTDAKATPKDSLVNETKKITGPVKVEVENKTLESPKPIEEMSEKTKGTLETPKSKEKATTTKPFDTIPQLDEVSLAQILQDNTTPSVAKSQQPLTTATTMSSPGLVGPLSPTLDLLGTLGAIQPEEEGLTEDLLMHVAQLVESSENLQEVIDKQVLGKVDTVPAKSPVLSPFQQTHAEPNLYTQTLSKTVQKNITAQRKDPIEIVRRDGRVITLPPIEAPATRSSKRKSQMEATNVESPTVQPVLTQTRVPTPEPQMPPVCKQYINKKPNPKKQEIMPQTNLFDKLGAESQDSWNSEDDPNRLWCICKQPHNNRFMICCDSCEDWFHGKCVNITKAMGQQMEEQGIEWRCPNCIKKMKTTLKTTPKTPMAHKKREIEPTLSETPLAPERKKEGSGKTICIVCKKHARASSIYCSDACILKHAQDSLVSSPNQSKVEEAQPQDKQNAESRVIVYERKSGRLLAGPNAPTAENLKAWIQKNPTFEVVRPGALNTIRPNTGKRKISTEPTKIQTTLNFERIPKKNIDPAIQTKSPVTELKERIVKPLLSPKDEPRQVSQPKTPITPKSHQNQFFDTPKPSGSGIRSSNEKRKNSRSVMSRSYSLTEKGASVTPSPSRKKESRENKSKMNSLESIRENVRKSLQEQMSLRMAESKDCNLTEDEIEQFAEDTESELHDLFSDGGMKYKAKYRSLMFNIKDRKNLTLWEKICHKSITPKQLVRLSPEELASQELAEWRDQEAKHQLELIKKSELDLLAASKTYVLKTHKGEEVMETKESVSTELDPNVPVEDVVSVLNDAINDDVQEKEKTPDMARKNSNRKINSRKREREESIDHFKKSRRDSRRDSEKKSRSSRRRRSTTSYERDLKLNRRSSRRSQKQSRSRSISKDRSKTEKDRSELRGRTRYRSKSKERPKRRSKSHIRSRSKSREKSRDRSRRRSRSKSTSKRQISENKPLTSTEDKQLRSRSQEHINIKTKHDSADTESTERPKSAMMKEVHPEYDPHEPMITSAFSDEDLRKSSEDVYEEDYKNTDSVQCDSKLAENEISKPSAYQGEEKTSEAESDQEPSSTVDTIPVATVWNGCINMVDVARFYVSAYEVSGSAVDLEDDLPTELDIVGRINPDTVWDYIGKMKKASNKDIIILRLQAANDEEKMPYIALFSYLSSRNRLGVVKVSNTTTVKDFYVVPLPANSTLPPVLMPLDGPGVGEIKTHQLLTIVIRQRKKRLASHIPKEIIPAKIARESKKRSYTPPVPNKTGLSPPASPRRRAPLPLPSTYTTALSTSVKDKIAPSLGSGTADEDEPYSPGSSSSGSGNLTAPSSTASSSLRSKMEELNRQIEEQKQQIRKIAQASSSGEDEAYSPSRPMTPPAPSVVPLADISLPSNLQEILATIKQRSETNSADVDMRNLP